MVILSLRAGPLGTGTETTSLRLWPSSARPTGDSFESFDSAGLASAEPTIVNFCELPVFSSLTWTVEPMPATSVGDLAGVDHRRRAKPLLDLRDPLLEIACSFLASSYSEFSVMSPELARLLDPLARPHAASRSRAARALP